MVHAQRRLQQDVKSVLGEHGVQMELLIAASAQVSQMKCTRPIAVTNLKVPRKSMIYICDIFLSCQALYPFLKNVVRVCLVET